MFALTMMSPSRRSAAAAGKRGQSTVAPAPDARNNYPGSVPRNGVRADRDWCAGAPRSGPPAIFGSFHRWKEHKRESSAAPAAGSFARGGKGTKTPLFAAPLACSLNRRAKFEWLLLLLPGHWALAGGGWGFLVSLGPPGFCHVFGWLADGGPMRHRPLQGSEAKLANPRKGRLLSDSVPAPELVRGKRSFPQSSLPSFLSRKRRRGRGPRRRGRPGGSRR